MVLVHFLRRLLFVSIFMLLTISSVQIILAQETKEPLHIDLSKTLGFVMGQRLSLNRIKVEYPTLSTRVQKVDLEFKSAFEIAEKNIEKALRDILKEKYSEYLAAMKNKIKSTIITQKIDQKIAEQFLDEIESRTNGVMPSPILETLLNYQFEDNPVDEFNRGFKKKYETKGHPKAKGLDLQIEYPKSWSMREGNRPNVIQFFSSNNGRGPVDVMIMTRDIIKESQGKLSHEEITTINTREGSKGFASELFSESNIREMVNGMSVTNVRDITTKRIVLDGWPGAMIEFIGDQQRLDITIMMYNRLYVAVYKNYVIYLHCVIGKLPDDSEDSLKNKISMFAPLFHKIANSLVIQSQY